MRSCYKYQFKKPDEVIVALFNKSKSQRERRSINLFSENADINPANYANCEILHVNFLLLNIGCFKANAVGHLCS